MSASDRVRRIADRDGWICNGCGETCGEWDDNERPERWATVDHKVFDGGDDDSNLWLMCNVCNSSKGQKPLEEWEKTLDFTGTFFRKGFTSVPNVLLENSSLTLGARMALIALMSFAWKGDPFPGQERLGKMLGVSDRTVREYLGELVTAEYLLVKRRGRGMTNVYRINQTQLLKSVAVAEESSDEEPQTEDQDRKHSSVLERKPASDKEVPRTKELTTTPISPANPEVRESATVKQIYNHWREARGKTRSSYDVISPNRRNKIKARLKEFPVEDLIAAIDNLSRDPWPDRALHDDITLIFRSREQVERFLEMGRLPIYTNGVALPPKRLAETWVRSAGWQYSDADLWEDLGKFDLSPTDKRAMVALAAQLQEANA